MALFKKLTAHMVVDHLELLDRNRVSHCPNGQNVTNRRIKYSEAYMRDVEAVMRDLGSKGFLSLSGFGESIADGWQKLGSHESGCKDIVFYHQWTKHMVMEYTSPHFYLHYRGNKKTIIDSCKQHGFIVNQAKDDLISISKTIDFNW